MGGAPQSPLLGNIHVDELHRGRTFIMDDTLGGLNMPHDADVIARLYPADIRGFARDVIENHVGHTPPRCPTPDRTSRESTPELEWNDPNDELPFIEFNFRRPPRSSAGFIFGTGRNSDVVLRNREGRTVPGLSRSHFALTYKNTFDDGCHRLVVRDLDSVQGLIITYDGEGNHRRRKFDWVVSGFGFPTRTETLIIQPDPQLVFRLVVTHHDVNSPTYNANVQMIRRGAAPAMDSLGGLGLENGPETEPQTGVHTPLKEPILVERGLITKSASKIVTHYWNVSTGEEYACKSPAGARYDTRDWENQIRTMGKVSHVSPTHRLDFRSLWYSRLTRNT